jgi:hypothetical protein
VNQAPTIVTMAASSNPVWCTDLTTITVAASDDHSVTGVSLSWTGLVSNSAAMTKSGSVWTYSFDPPTDGGFSANVTFTAIATDGSLASAPRQLVLQVNCLG